jgi:succinate dehydrogenase / fumarate reductase, cytochrome b subunit
MPTPTPARADDTDPKRRAAAPKAPARVRRSPWLLEFYRSALGKKYAMALTGIVWMLYVFAHMVGNLKLYLGEEEMDGYAVWLRELGYPALPESGLLWIMRAGLIVALLVHIHAAYALTIMNRRARPARYESKRDYVAADFAARTMRWTGVIVLAFVVFHLADLTFGWANPNEDFVYAQTVYESTVLSFQRLPVAAFYVIANVALGYHLYHGAWSLFQSMGWNKPRFNPWRRHFAIAFALVVAIPMISFPIAVQLGIIS